MFVNCISTSFDMQRVLEGNLSIYLRSIILRHGILHGLEVKEIEGIGELVEETANALTLEAPRRLRAFSRLQTQPHPGFPTDMQAQMLAISCLAEGTSVIVENVFENRLGHVADLCRMGADIQVSGRTAVVRGVRALRGMRVTARDLRGGAALVLAGLAAQGETIVENAALIDRGYAHLEDTLTALGARIQRISTTEDTYVTANSQ